MNRCFCFIFLFILFAKSAYGQNEVEGEVNEALPVEDTASEMSAGRSASTNEAIEQVTKPVTSWVEDKIQNSSLIQSSAHSREYIALGENELSLREAILLAREQFSGSILSAERVIEEDQKWFRIKILSDTGILKIINIDAIAVDPVNKPITEPNLSVIEDLE